MRSAEAIRNGSEPKVPNSGRPPVLNDQELLELATQLNDKLGRPPKANELIEAAGGCQKKRALTAIDTLKTELARAAVRSRLQFPGTIESALRGLMTEWLAHASEQLVQQHVEEAQRIDEKSNGQMQCSMSRGLSLNYYNGRWLSGKSSSIIKLRT